MKNTISNVIFTCGVRPDFLIYLFKKFGKEEEIKARKCCIGKIKFSGGFKLSLKSNLNVPAHARHYKVYVKGEGSCRASTLLFFPIFSYILTILL